MEEKSVTCILRVGNWSSGWHLACSFQHQGVFKQAEVSSCSLHYNRVVSFAVLRCTYLLCCVMNSIDEPIQVKNSCQWKSNNVQTASVSKRSAAKIYIHWRRIVFARIMLWQNWELNWVSNSSLVSWQAVLMFLQNFKYIEGCIASGACPLCIGRMNLRREALRTK